MITIDGKLLMSQYNTIKMLLRRIPGMLTPDDEVTHNLCQLLGRFDGCMCNHKSVFEAIIRMTIAEAAEAIEMLVDHENNEVSGS